MFTYFLYASATIGLGISFVKSRQKTKMALKKAWKSFEGVLPSLLCIILIIGIMLSVIDTDTISKWIGSESGVLGIAIASTVGSITLIPGFVAFPLASSLLNNGAGVSQIAAFVSTLMMVGVVTAPLEIKTFGKKATVVRNISAFVFSLFVALMMGLVLG
ncbi:MAG: permease [Lachnospiraceae bacterium]